MGALIWLKVIAQLIALGQTTVEEVAGLVREFNAGNDIDTQAADDEALAQLRVVIQQRRDQARAEAGG